jgi:hypothetical protein
LAATFLSGGSIALTRVELLDTSMVPDAWLFNRWNIKIYGMALLFCGSSVDHRNATSSAMLKLFP